MSFVVGTAGHIDHGKSALVRALTGIDPDRLEEEKRRGMTIDLGFAHLSLPSGEVGIVDVPGHARFIHNMLAGVHGLDAVILVVAADEGVMPQTREHLEIIDLLGVRRGLVALSKVDLVDAEWLELVSGEVRETLAGTSLEGAALLPTSTVSGRGLAELKVHLDRLCAGVPARIDRGRPRLPVDRVFTISGFGTVVTGTLIDGRLRVGEEVELRPSGLRARVRGLQQHNRKVEVAEPGGRVAANLAGVEKEELRRGEVLGRPGGLAATRRIDASVRVVAGAPRGLRHGVHLILHTGTAETHVRAVVLAGDEIPPGAGGWVQLYLEQPVAVAAGDRFVLRLPSPPATLAGGVFVDAAPRRHPRHDAQVAASLERRLAGEALAEELRKHPLGITEQALLKATLAEPADLSGLAARRAGSWLFAPEVWTAVASRVGRSLTAYHRAYPLRAGMPREELRSRLGLTSAAFGSVLGELVGEGAVVEREGELALPDHRVALDPQAVGGAARLVELLGAHPFAPPSLPEATQQAGVTEEVVRALARQGDLVRLSPEVALTRAAYDAALGIVRELVARDGSVTVASLRDRLGASRRPALALLEHLDAQRITRRLGDARVLR